MQAEGKKRMARVNQHPVGGGCLDTSLWGAADRRGDPQPRRRAKAKKNQAERGGGSEHRVRLLSTQTSVTLPSSPARQVSTPQFNVARHGRSER